jgi:hypothetical protein
MVQEATVDCYNRSEESTALFTMMEERLTLPFETAILGAVVTVEALDLDDRDEIVAVCARDGRRQRIAILDLPTPSSAPPGAEWIAAYRHWRRE